MADAHLINLIGAFVVDASDELEASLSEETGLTGSGPAALLAIHTWPDRPIEFLRRVLDLTHPGTLRVVGRLEAMELVARERGQDRRTVVLRLTRHGEALVERAFTARAELLGGLIEGASSEERDVLAGLLERHLRGRPRTRWDARHVCRLCDHSVCRGEACPVGRSADAA